MTISIVELFLCAKAGENMQSVKQVSLVAGKGIEGDRYYLGTGTFSERLKNNPAAEISLIESEEIDLFNKKHSQSHSMGDFRRNIVTSGVRLNDLVDKDFFIGDVQLRGIRLCEPCKYLAKTVNPLVLPHLVGRAGLRAQIVTGGVLKLGDKFTL